MIRPIATGLSPNLEISDVFLAAKNMLFFWDLRKGSNTSQLEQWFRQYLKVTFAISFNSARSSLFVVLKSLGIGKDDEVILQAFTCVAVPNAIVWTGAKPIFVDIDNIFFIDSEKIEKKITKKTKAIIVQYTFGIPGNMEKIKKIAKKHKIFLIEDCAHVIGGMYKDKKLGTLGDAAIFSFGRDKAFSSVFGGVATTNNETIGKKIREFQKIQDYPSITWTLKQLAHPIAFLFVLPLYNVFSIGKILLVFLQKLRVLTFPVSKEEKDVNITGLLIKKMPNSLASLALSQLKRLEKFNLKRKYISSLYIKYLNDLDITVPSVETSVVYLRFPILIEDPASLHSFARKQGIYFGSWYSGLVDPKGVQLDRLFYEQGMCPKAEYFAKRIVNLPVYPTMSKDDVGRVIYLLKDYDAYRRSNG